ncbi:PilW family protein [Acinetobacter colistiniresistens]|nr:PilW family protein [Acinetobacter colistiniresistens]TVT81939.1 prepilin-type N-terminal cleavage/methylation domain-containing protein [Acinetobacter colistiniresistens]
MINQQKGLTLLELMIALSLGLLIVAAGTAVFLSGQRSLGLQGSMGELQQNANFGLSMITHDLRHANLNTPSTQKVNNKQVGSGVIFTTANLPSSLSKVNASLLTGQAKDSDATTGNSDQLTIQFIPEYQVTTKKKCKQDKPNCTADADKEDVTIYTAKNVDCEGNRLEFDKVTTIVQRYHLKTDPNQIDGQPTAYSLYCDAGYYQEGDTTITNMTVGANGTQLMQRIDTFKVRLEVKDMNGKLRYMSINDYLALMPVTVTDSKNYYNVVSVEIGLLARSTTPLNSEALIDNAKVFKIIGSDATLNDGQQKGSKFLREVFSQVVAFRNTLGASS